MSELTVKFNSIDLSQFFRVVDIDRADQNQIVLTVKMRTSDSRSMQQAKRELRKILMTNSYYELIFSDEPELFYYAKVIKPFDESNGISWLQEVEITFNTLDGYAYSSSYQEIESNKITSSNNVITVEFDNEGSAMALPIIEVTHNDENGFLGVATSNSSLEIGNVETPDTIIQEQSEMLLNFKPFNATGMLAQGVQGVGIANDKGASLNGTLSSIIRTNGVSDVEWVCLSSPGSDGGKLLNGQSLTYTAPADSNGDVGTLFDTIYWRQVFHTSALNQQSAIKVTVSDADNNFLYGVETIKRSNTNLTEFNCMIGNPNKYEGYDIVRRSTFQANHILSQNPFMNSNGHMAMYRNDDVITFFERGYTKHQSDYLKGKKSVKVHVLILKYKNSPQVTDMFISDLIWQKHHISETVDVPNRYVKYSKVILDNEIGKVTVDGMPEKTVLGSEYTKLPPGISVLKFYFSSWLTTLPDVKLKYRKRYR